MFPYTIGGMGIQFIENDLGPVGEIHTEHDRCRAAKDVRLMVKHPSSAGFL